MCHLCYRRQLQQVAIIRTRYDARQRDTIVQQIALCFGIRYRLVLQGIVLAVRYSLFAVRCSHYNGLIWHCQRSFC